MTTDYDEFLANYDAGNEARVVEAWLKWLNERGNAGVQIEFIDENGVKFRSRTMASAEAAFELACEVAGCGYLHTMGPRPDPKIAGFYHGRRVFSAKIVSAAN